MSTRKLLMWSSIAAAICGLYYFRGDIKRYTKMKMM
jgi:hypothetical protein